MKSSKRERDLQCNKPKDVLRQSNMNSMYLPNSLQIGHNPTVEVSAGLHTHPWETAKQRWLSSLAICITAILGGTESGQRPL